MWLLGVALLGAGVGVGSAGEPATGAVVAVAGAGLVALCVVYRGLQPVAYALDGSGLAIERRRRAPRRYAGLVAVLPGRRLGLRVAGSGGLYGYLGRFRLAGGGRVTAYVTSRAATLILRVGDTNVAVSPADRQAFLREVEADGA